MRGNSILKKSTIKSEIHNEKKRDWHISRGRARLGLFSFPVHVCIQ